MTRPRRARVSSVSAAAVASRMATVRHDGYVIVADIGDMTLDQIDFYKGATQDQTVSFVSDAKHLVDAVVVIDPAVANALRKEHGCACA